MLFAWRCMRTTFTPANDDGLAATCTAQLEFLWTHIHVSLSLMPNIRNELPLLLQFYSLFVRIRFFLLRCMYSRGLALCLVVRVYARSILLRAGIHTKNQFALWLKFTQRNSTRTRHLRLDQNDNLTAMNLSKSISSKYRKYCETQTNRNIFLDQTNFVCENYSKFRSCILKSENFIPNFSFVISLVRVSFG